MPWLLQALQEVNQVYYVVKEAVQNFVEGQLEFLQYTSPMDLIAFNPYLVTPSIQLEQPKVLQDCPLNQHQKSLLLLIARNPQQWLPKISLLVEVPNVCRYFFYFLSVELLVFSLLVFPYLILLDERQEKGRGWLVILQLIIVKMK